MKLYERGRVSLLIVVVTKTALDGLSATLLALASEGPPS
jgi:hypothetical protein